MYIAEQVTHDATVITNLVSRDRHAGVGREEMELGRVEERERMVQLLVSQSYEPVDTRHPHPAHRDATQIRQTYHV